MIEKLGIGIDIVDIEQFKKIPYRTRPNFYKKLFSPSEIKYCLKYKNAAEHFAGKFAIKEAVKKSISLQIRMLDIETSHYKLRPVVKLKGRYANHYVFLISLSHEKNAAVGIVISEKINTHD
ncbi:holo-ACP synthase [Candidatus Nitrosotenuis cloacae]|uniref:holo-ACP synthase n=1 Tax=Candidatus Nitrosotenuis cloacae TaxID=1603555 RepID=UPI0022822FED|nr:holo-ACP synthase [Candidatus Nitrosotenuis cloacae]